MMRIALITAEYPPTPGGIGDYTRQLGLALTQLGQTVQIWTGRGTGLAVLDPHTPIPATAPDLLRWNWGCWRALEHAIQTQHPDLLHIQYQTGAYAMHPAINLFPARSRMRRLPPVLVTAHDLLLPYLFPKAGHLRHWVTRRLLVDSAATLVTNQADLQAITGKPQHQNRAMPRFTGTLPKPPVLIPIGSNIAVAPPPDYSRAAWRMELGIRPDELVLAYFGLISATKGLDVILAALDQLPNSVRLLIIGGQATSPADHAYAATLQPRLQSYGQRVIQTGHCPEPHVSGHLLAADLVALPFSDGASFRRGSLLAALSHGCATITTWGSTDAPAPSDPASNPTNQLVDQYQVRLIAPGDPHALASMIQQLAADPDQRQRLGQAARHYAERFAWPAIAEGHVQLYRSVLGHA